jgi:Beta protein
VARFARHSAASTELYGLNLTPLVEVPPIPPAYQETVIGEEPIPAKTIDKHVKDVGKKFIQAFQNLPSVFIDGYYIEVEEDLEDDSSPIDSIFASLRGAKIPFVPVIGLDRVEDYADSVQGAIEKDKRGCCLRLVESDLEGMTELGAQIEALLKVLVTKPDEVDLLIDFGSKVPSKAALPFIVDALPKLSDWRTLTVAASSFPADMSGVGKNKIEELEREEWRAWLSVRSKKKGLKRIPTFGDYGINHPILSEIDPRTMHMSPNIRYTNDLNFVVAKGQAQPRKKWAVTAQQKIEREQLAPKIQYPKLAKKITNHPSWKGATFSWGDEFIDKCSRKECAGSATDWRAVGTCHHIALVVRQIASLP